MMIGHGFTSPRTAGPATERQDGGRRSIAATLSLLLLVFMLSACVVDSGECSAYAAIDPEGWAYADAKSFSLSLTDSVDSVPVTGQLAVVVRHDNSYEFSNIWLQLTYDTGDTLMVDTINMPLADAYGKWIGHGIGVSFQRMLPLDGDVVVDLSAPVRLAHIMRADTLPHIQQVGVVFTKKEITRN